MSKTGQNFYIYQGDAQAPVFTIYGSDGVTPLDISTAQDLQWIAYTLPDQTPPSISKKKSVGGGVSFVSTGSDGKLQVNLANADSAALAFGWYFHGVIITDASGNKTTVSVGRMAVLARGNLS